MPEHVTSSPDTYIGHFRSVVAARGKHPAIVTAEDQLDYAELDARSARLARALLARGAGKGARIGLLAPDGAFWLTGLIAGLRIGAIVTLVSTLATPPELAHILRNSDIQFLIAARRYLKHDYANTLERALPGLAESEANRLRLPMAPFLRSIWLDDVEGVAWAEPVTSLLAEVDRDDSPDDALLRAAEAEVHPGDDALIIYTSGSTSLPKAVVHTQRNVTTHPIALAPYFLITPEDRMMSLLPAFWLGGLATTLQVLAVGGTLIYAKSPDPQVVLDTFIACEANALHCWGVRLDKLRDAAIARGMDVGSIRGLGPPRDKAGQPIPADLRVNMMGMSESFSPHSAEPVNIPLPPTRSGAAGRAVNGYERRVVNPETGEELAPGEIGEMQIRGGALMSGFYKRSREEVFTRDGFYSTGDLARIDEDGWVWFLGRRGDMIKTGTANVSRQEIEAALLQLPAVKWAYAAGLPDAELGQRIVAAVVLGEGVVTHEDELRMQLREIISSYKIPRRILFITEDDIRLTATGKLMLSEMTDMLARSTAE